MSGIANEDGPYPNTPVETMLRRADVKEPTEADVAASLRARLSSALGPVLDVLNEARSSGFEVNFVIDNGMNRPNGRRQVQEITIVRHY